MAHERDVSIRFHSASLNGDELDIHRVVGIDRISSLFRYTIVASRLPEFDVDEDALMLQPAWITYSVGDEEVGSIYGLVWSIRELAEPEVAAPRIEITLVPRAHAATLREMLDIFMEVTVPDIIEACLTRCGLTAGEHFDLGGLEENYRQKEFVVQYRETDFAFISRLCEHHGIFFFVDHSTGKDVLTFGDRNTIFPASERTPELPFRPVATTGTGYIERVQNVDVTRNPLPKRYTVRDYNYRMPGVDLMSSADVDPNGLGEIVEYGPHFKDPDEGQWFADIRAQELASRQRIYTLQGNALALCAGQTFMLTEHPGGDIELLVTAVRQTSKRESSTSARPTDIEAIPLAVAYRPPRLTPKPHVNGIITGMIDAGVRDGYADVDDQGRYRVRFMFDTAARGEGQASRLVRMAQPHAGEGYGMHFPLRPGTEVILSCIDGDPDRPIITGTVPNPATVSPVSSANRDRNLIRTGGGNEIDISDEDGMHRIKMTTPHMGTVFQIGAENAAEVGAIISTHANVVSQAADTVGAMADVASTINDVMGNITGQSITSTAGIPDPIKGFEAVDKLLQSGAKAASSLAKTVDTIANFGKSISDNNKAEIAKRKTDAQKAILALNPPQKYPDNAKKTTVGTAPNQVEVVETEAQFNKRVVDERIASGQASADQRSAYETAVSDADQKIYYPIPFMDNPVIDGSVGEAYADSSFKEYLDKGSSALSSVAAASTSVQGAVKSVKKLFSTSHKTLQKAMDSIAKAGSTATAGAANAAAVASLPRRAQTVRLPGAHYNLITATDSVITEGAQAFYGMSPLKSYVFGGTLAMVVSDSTLSLYSGLKAELAAPLTIMTSTHLDTLARKSIKIKSGTSTTLTVGKKLTIVTDDDTSMESKTKFFLKTKDLLDVDGGDEAKMKAKKWSVEATDADYKMKTKGTFEVESTGLIELKHDNTSRFFANGANASIDNLKSGASVWVGSSNAKMEIKSSSVEVTSSSVTAKASSSITVDASTVNVKGKVMLG